MCCNIYCFVRSKTVSGEVLGLSSFLKIILSQLWMHLTENYFEITHTLTIGENPDPK